MVKLVRGDGDPVQKGLVTEKYRQGYNGNSQFFSEVAGLSVTILTAMSKILLIILWKRCSYSGVGHPGLPLPEVEGVVHEYWR